MQTSSVQVQLVDKALNALGVSAGVLLFITGIGISAYVYIQYLESKKLNLEIIQLQKTLGIQERNWFKV